MYTSLGIRIITKGSFGQSKNPVPGLEFHTIISHFPSGPSIRFILSLFLFSPCKTHTNKHVTPFKTEIVQVCNYIHTRSPRQQKFRTRIRINRRVVRLLSTFSLLCILPCVLEVSTQDSTQRLALAYIFEPLRPPYFNHVSSPAGSPISTPQPNLIFRAQTKAYMCQHI